ncbi:Uncharacterised protein [Mycobacterium tuberculosis]|nr:Uncharacterised protein [Mycobacterium tuberculosis]
MNRISTCAPAGHGTTSTAATLPSTVIGAITAATARLATTATRLTRPEMAATSGAVTSCAAAATARASASTFGHPRSTKRRDQTGAMTTSAPVAATDSAKPMSTARWGAAASKTSTLPDKAGIACRRRADSIPTRAMAPITAARNTLAVGCTRMTNATNATAAHTTAARGPINRAETSAAAHTIVTLAPETAVKCVRPAARNSRLVKAVTVEVSPRTRAGNIVAWSAGSTSRTAAANRWRTM